VPQRVLTLRTTLSFSKYTTDEQSILFVKKLLDRLKAEPGVLSAAVTNRYPFEPEFIEGGAQGVSFSFEIEGHPVQPGQAPPVSTYAAVSPDYFHTLGIPLTEGRLFTENDDPTGPNVILINEAMKRQLWPKEDPVGKRVTTDGGKHWAQIIGVVGDVREFGLDHPPVPEVYTPQKINPQPGAVLVRTAAEPRSMAKALTAAIHEVDPQTAVTRVKTVEQARYESMANPRVTATLLALFGALALAIATAGIGGIMALNVSQRVREIGIRIALGAPPMNIVRMVLGQGLMLTLLGIGIGVTGAYALTGMVKSLLFGVPPTDLLTFCGVGLTLLAAAGLASYLPARRAAAVDPNDALRSE
jgi:putative ABC transport system permease protein